MLVEDLTKQAIWMVGILDRFLKTRGLMDHRISLEFRFVEQQGNAAVGFIRFNTWSTSRLQLPVLIGTRNDVRFIRGKGLNAVIDSEGRISVLDTDCLKMLDEKHHSTNVIRL